MTHSHRRHHHHAVLPALLICLAGCGGGGGGDGDPDPGGGGGGKLNKTGKLATVNIVNATQVAGSTVFQVVVPLSPDAHRSAPNVRNERGQACQAFAMGPRFPDGSLRYLRLEVPVTVEAGNRRALELRYTDQLDPAFVQPAGIPGTIGVDVRLRVGNNTVTFPAPSLIEDGPVVRVYRSRLRGAGTMIWGELTVSVYSGLPHAKFTLHWGLSHPGYPNLFQDPGEVEFQVNGAAVEFEHQSKILARKSVGGDTRVLLHAGGAMADGQSQLVEGRFVFSGSASPPRVFAIADGWVAAKTFGPLGDLVPEITVEPNGFAELVAQNEGKHQDHPWARPVHGCNPDPSNTGHQEDFGNIRMRADVLLADPRRLSTIIRSVYQEACRATHHREIDISRVTVAAHPELLTAAGRPKASESKDMLGKSKGWLTLGMRSPKGDKWHGHDGQHLSINFLAGIALLTGNRFAREECDNHAMLYLTGFTYKAGSWNDHPGRTRKVSRSAFAAIWMWLVTGREDVRERLVLRTDDVLVTMGTFNKKFPVVSHLGTVWTIWEEGQVCGSMAAVHHNFGTASALEIIRQVSRTVVMNGYAKTINGDWRCAYRPPFVFPNGSAYVARLDPNFASNKAGGGLTMWGIPGVFLAADSHPDPAVRSQALTIIRDMYAGSTNGLAEELNWIGVTPNAAALAQMVSAF